MDTDYYKQYEPFFGSWKIVRLIGEGTYGKVFEIRRSEYGIEEKAALKIISIPASKSEYNSVLTDCMDELSATEYFRNYMQEMIREISLMSKLKGNSYIVCYEDHEVKNRAETVGWDIMIRMELLTPLNEYTREKGTLGKDEVIHLGIDICKALEICQKYDIIHRDIKPENIFVADYGNFKLGDFGIARIASQTSGASTRAGTNAYMAPEVYRGEHYGKTVDLYSLGLVLYRLLNNNRLPFMPQYPAPLRFQDRENAQAMRLSGAPIPAPTHADPALANVIAKACAYNAEDRFSSATDMRLSLESLLQPEKTASGTVHIASESPQPSSNTTPNQYGEASNESNEATISRFADNAAATQQEDEDKTVSRFTYANAPVQSDTTLEQGPVPSVNKNDSSAIVQKPKKKSGLKSTVAITLAGAAIVGGAFLKVTGIKSDHASSSPSIVSANNMAQQEESKYIVKTITRPNEFSGAIQTETFGYADASDTKWNTLQIDSSDCDVQKLERTFDENGYANQVTVTYKDGKTGIFSVTHEENSQQEKKICIETLKGEVHLQFEITLQDNQDGKPEVMAIRYFNLDVGDGFENKSNVVYKENGLIELHQAYTDNVVNNDENQNIVSDNHITSIKNSDSSNPNLYSAIVDDDDLETFELIPEIEGLTWGQLVFLVGDTPSGSMFYRGNWLKALVGNSIASNVTAFIMYEDFSFEDPFDIADFGDYRTFRLDGNVTETEYDENGNLKSVTATQNDGTTKKFTFTYTSIE